MSRAFVTDKEDWVYCAKAGERCMHADPDKDCRRTDCEHYHQQATPTSGADAPGLRIVARRKGPSAAERHASAKNVPKAGSADDRTPGRTAGRSGSPAGGRPAGPAKTRRANIKMPRRWGGRSGGNF